MKNFSRSCVVLFGATLFVLGSFTQTASAELADKALNYQARIALNEYKNAFIGPRIPLSDTEMAELPYLVHSGQSLNGIGNTLYDIESLEGAQGFISMQTFVLTDQHISDITPLTGLERLQWLDLSQGLVESLPAMDAMSALTGFTIADNLISDLSDFTAPQSLWRLDLSGNLLTDISDLMAALASCDSLARIDLRGNPLDSIAHSRVLPILQAQHPDAELLFDPIPEPMTIVLVLGGAAMILRRRR